MLDVGRISLEKSSCGSQNRNPLQRYFQRPLSRVNPGDRGTDHAGFIRGGAELGLRRTYSLSLTFF